MNKTKLFVADDIYDAYEELETFLSEPTVIPISISHAYMPRGSIDSSYPAASILLVYQEAI